MSNSPYYRCLIKVCQIFSVCINPQVFCPLTLTNTKIHKILRFQMTRVSYTHSMSVVSTGSASLFQSSWYTTSWPLSCLSIILRYPNKGAPKSPERPLRTTLRDAWSISQKPPPHTFSWPIRSSACWPTSPMRR